MIYDGATTDLAAHDDGVLISEIYAELARQGHMMSVRNLLLVARRLAGRRWWEIWR